MSVGVPSIPTTPKSALPDFLRAAPAQNLTALIVGTPQPIVARMSRDGVITFKRGKRVLHTAQSVAGVIVAWGFPRAMWSTEVAADGQSPDCTSSDGLRGKGRHLVQPGVTALIPDESGEYRSNSETSSGPVVVERPCSSCPLAQFGSGKGNAQKCKQMIRFALYLPTAQGNAPWLESETAGQIVPIQFTLPPSNFQQWDAHIQWIQSIGFPVDGVFTKLAGESVNMNGFTVGVLKFEGVPMNNEMRFYYDEAQKSKEHATAKDLTTVGGGDYAAQSETGGVKSDEIPY